MSVAVEAVHRIINDNDVGKTITLRRVTPGTFDASTGSRTGDTNTDVKVKAAIREYTPQELTERVQQGDREVLVPAKNLTLTPQRNDTVIIGTKKFNIESVEEIFSGEKTLAHRLQIRGVN